MLIDSTLNPGLIDDLIYTFVIDVQHCVVNVMDLPAIASVEHIIKQGVQSHFFLPATFSDLACEYDLTYTIESIKVGGSSNPQPTWMTFDGPTQSFTFNAADPSDVKVYSITVTASIPQPSDPSGVKTVSKTFDLTVLSDCVLTTFVQEVIPEIRVHVYNPAVS